MDDLIERGKRALARLRQAKSEQDRILRKMGGTGMPPTAPGRATRQSPPKRV